MKRIISFLLIFLIFIFLGLIIIQKYEHIEKFQNSTSQAVTDIPSVESTSTTSTLSGFEEEISGGTIILFNVDKIENKFHYNPNELCQITECDSSTSCNINQSCRDIYGQNMCLNFIDKTSYVLNSEDESFIKLENNNISKFDFSFRFLLKNNENMQYIISSKSELWCMYVKDRNLYLRLNDDSIEQINNIPLICYEIYKLIISVSEDRIQININTRSSTIEIFLKNPECQFDRDCFENTGKCEGLRDNKKCRILEDTYYFGKYNNNFYSIVIGDIKIISSETQASQEDGCNFFGREFKNKRLCLEACNNNQQCSQSYCNTQCENVPMCEFETIGRHSVDCIQECIRNNDCNAEFCIDKCENCAPFCPWNKKIVNNDFDSQYFDPQGKPSPIKLLLNTISTDGTKISVRWRTPFEGKAQIRGYISYLFKTFNKSEGVKINKINVTTCNNSNCEYIVKDLTPNDTYTLGIKSYNDIGLSKISNLLTFKANVTNINMNLDIEPDISDNLIGDFSYCNINE